MSHVRHVRHADYRGILSTDNSSRGTFLLEGHAGWNARNWTARLLCTADCFVGVDCTRPVSAASQAYTHMHARTTLERRLSPEQIALWSWDSLAGIIAAQVPCIALHFKEPGCKKGVIRVTCVTLPMTPRLGVPVIMKPRCTAAACASLVATIR